MRAALGLVAACLAVALGGEAATLPGFRMEVTAQGLSYLRQVGLPLLFHDFQGESLPDVEGEASTPIGTVTYHLTNIKIQSVSASSTSSRIFAGKGVGVDASGVDAQITADWDYRRNAIPHIKGSGTLTATATQSSLSLNVSAGTTSAGKLFLSAVGCASDIDNFEIEFDSGKAKWLYNLFKSVIASSIKGTLNGKLCSIVSEVIDNKATAVLQTFPLVRVIDGISELDFAILEPPSFSSVAVRTGHRGEFRWVERNTTEAPYTPTALPNVTDTGHMAFIWVSQYTPLTAAWVYQQAGKLRFNITADMVPASSPVKLNTESFALIIPELYLRFPDRPMQVYIYDTGAPAGFIAPSEANVTFYGDIVTFVVLPNGTLFEAFVLTGYTTAAGDVALKYNATSQDTLVYGNLTKVHIDTTIAKSNVGWFPVSALDLALNTLGELFILPMLNRGTNGGVAIPRVDNVYYKNATSSKQQGYVLISTDFEYRPS